MIRTLVYKNEVMTYQESVVLANKIKKLSPAIMGVELFGSVLQKGYGRDADYLILVEDNLAKRWWHDQRELIRVRWPDSLYNLRWVVKKFIPFAYSKTVHKRRHTRLVASLNMLGINLETLADSAGKVPDFEVFLVPVNWRIGTEINNNEMGKITDLVNHKNTLGFLKRIAKDAVIVT